MQSKIGTITKFVAFYQNLKFQTPKPLHILNIGQYLQQKQLISPRFWDFFKKI